MQNYLGNETIEVMAISQITSSFRKILQHFFEKVKKTGKELGQACVITDVAIKHKDKKNKKNYVYDPRQEERSTLKNLE